MWCETTAAPATVKDVMWIAEEVSLPQSLGRDPWEDFLHRQCLSQETCPYQCPMFLIGGIKTL